MLQKDTLEDEVNEENQKVFLSCIQCDNIFNSKHALKTHLNKDKHSKVSHVCKLCRMTFKKKANLKRHNEKQHNKHPKDLIESLLSSIIDKATERSEKKVQTTKLCK